jgi:hypothetical protein
MTESWVSVANVAKREVPNQRFDLPLDREARPKAREIGRFWKFKLTEVDDWVRAGSARIGRI